MKLSPIAFFAYARQSHTIAALTALSRCKLAEESTLYIFCDGAKSAEDRNRVKEVQDVVRSKKWCGNVDIVVREKNMGLANSIIYGVSSLIEKYGRVIVLEDDLLVSPFFLTYMNNALARYERDEQVMQISGYMFDIHPDVKTDAFFLPFTSSWGWATWKRAWKIFDPLMGAYDQLKSNKQLRNKFNLNGAYDYFGMLKMQKEGKIDSWAIRWYLSVFMDGGLILYPAKTLIKNIGWDASGVHCGNTFCEDKIDEEFKVLVYPTHIAVSSELEKLQQHLRRKAGNISKIKKFFDVLMRRSV